MSALLSNSLPRIDKRIKSNHKMARIELVPSGKVLHAPEGTSVRETLFDEGVEFPCGGMSRCRRCKVRVLRGHWPASLKDLRLFSSDEIRDGWRLSCQGAMQGNLALEVAQWDSPILADGTPFDFTPAEGLGIAVDLGTTTIAAQLLDLRTARILAVVTALNSQGAYGTDVMTRLDFALNNGAARLSSLIRKQINGIVNQLLARSARAANEVRSIVLVGNSAMHHLFCDLPIETLARDPFEPCSLEAQDFSGDDLGWDSAGLKVSFLPSIGGFVGSDILAGIIATRMHRRSGAVALMDLGTNGEVVVAANGKIVCASTAAGPAFEGARISSGMRAAAGAIHAVHLTGGAVSCDVLGGGRAAGICGSGLVDAAVVGLDAGIITASGRFANGSQRWELADSVALVQKDIRQLQLAKAAIAAGLLILLHETGASTRTLDPLFIAGAFGNYINLESACRIGLVPVRADQVTQVGNTALLGAKLALFPGYHAEYERARRSIRHVPLSERADFQELFVEQLQFPKSERIEGRSNSVFAAQTFF
jgi:uncharacterized 2Fe-2S/4Fe-4S cluster protein (DUF4445 family)